jgi:FkbM family methyltransferase
MSIPAYLLGDRIVLEQVSRQRAQALRLTGSEALCRVLGKYLMFADVEDFTVAPHLVMNGYWESWTTLAVARALGAGAHAVDVGANFGYFTMLMADAVGDEGAVLAIEPNPRLAALLSRTLEVNGVASRVRVVASAAGASSGASVRLKVPPHRWADATTGSIDCACDAIDVPVISVDDATAGWPRVDFVKIDAERSEPSIWDGMRRTLRRNPHIVVVMELKPDSGPRAEALLRSIAYEGFPLRYIDDDGRLQDLIMNDARSPRHERDWMMFLSRACPG